MPPDNDLDLTLLERGQLHWFRELDRAGVPKNVAGLYTVWDADQFIYAGIGGTKIVYREPDAETEPPRPVKGLWGRLEQHRTGQRSGDQFCVYVCDRFVVPALSREELVDLGAGRMSLDERAKRWINDRYGFRYVVTRDGAQARSLEPLVQAGVLDAGKPLLNPL